MQLLLIADKPACVQSEKLTNIILQFKINFFFFFFFVTNSTISWKQKTNKYSVLIRKRVTQFMQSTPKGLASVAESIKTRPILFERIGEKDNTMKKIESRDESLCRSPSDRLLVAYKYRSIQAISCIQKFQSTHILPHIEFERVLHSFSFVGHVFEVLRLCACKDRCILGNYKR